MGLVLLALEAQLRVTVHHVDHHAREGSGDDARFVMDFCADHGLACVVHDVQLAATDNFEARARAARRSVLPPGSLTGHTMDDLAETVVLNVLRGTGLDGLSPMVGDPTKPLRDLRRREVHELVAAAGVSARVDESNQSSRFRRNRVRHELLPLMNEVAGRDVVPLLARQAAVVGGELAWLDEVVAADRRLALGEADCRELREWVPARLARWLRMHLTTRNEHGEFYPPSADEIDRAMAVVRGEVVACELSGGRRLARRNQLLTWD
jgi:tRNA(Ile)-lysidine synthase